MPSRRYGNNTKLILAESLRNELKLKPLDKIKICDIVSDCGLNRQTFYYHFQDIYALVEWMYKHDGIQIIKDNYSADSIIPTARAMLIYVDEHREELQCVTNSKAERYFFDFIINGMCKSIEILIENKTADLKIDYAYRHFLAKYLTSAILGVVEAWIRTTEEDRPSIDELLRMFSDTVDGSMSLAIRNHIRNQNRY